MKTIHLICAARPNFMKIAPLYHALTKESWCVPKIVHTGQHYDYEMSQTFFDDLGLPPADHYLGIGSGTHAKQTAETMIAYETVCLEREKPDLVVVVGDVNATLACSIAAKKIHLPIAHLEAGLRSFDRTMPEEINRLVTDAISDYFWTPSQDANDHLEKEGVPLNRIHMVGNIMIDTYCMMKDKIEASDTYKAFGLEKKHYAVLTLHRPMNVDVKETLECIIRQVGKIDLPILLVAHPRTRKNLEGISSLPKNISLSHPLGYIDFMSLVANAAYVISDSGGIQEETTYLGIPCFTLRETTERPVTVTMGTNQLVSVHSLVEKVRSLKTGNIPPLWDGKTHQRVVNLIKTIVES